MRKRIKTTYLIKDGLSTSLISSLTEHYGLPEINSSLAMYGRYQDRVIEVKFINSTCHLRSYDKSSQIDKQFIDIFNSTPPIKIDNTNIKYFLRIINGLGFSKAYITDEVVQLGYRLSDGVGFININFGTPVGDLLIINNDLTDTTAFIDPQILESKLEPRDIDSLFAESTTSEEIFDSSRLLNHKIINYGDKFGIDIASSGYMCIKSKLSSKSNDYSYFEPYYKKVTSAGLNLDRGAERLKKDFFRPISVVICSYNSNESIVQVLYSIESQDLYPEQKRTIDVVVVDDGSDVSVAECLKPHIKDYSFSLNIVRFEKNKGLSNARNIGIANTINNHVLFIDADILLAKNYLLEHSTALQIFPHAIFVSMKNNIDKTSKFADVSVIKNGLEVPLDYDDKRITRVFERSQSWINQVDLDGVFETLSDTSLFKNFGHGRVVNGYDLPSMVTGHNMSISKNLLNKVGGFSKHFQGWGLEDTYFGAQVIASGGFVVPLINTGVYHINHPPRSGSEERHREEYAKNIGVYNRLIEQQYENIYYKN